MVRSNEPTSPALKKLKEYIESLAAEGALRDKNLARARVAVLTDLIARRAEIAPLISEALVADIEGRLTRIVETLRTKNVFLLPGGALEHYLPSYAGDRYSLNEAAKRKAVEAEVTKLSEGEFDEVLAQRYGALFENIVRLPAKAPVDTDAVLLGYLGDYVYRLQGLVVGNGDWGLGQLNAHFAASSTGLGKLFEIVQFERRGHNEFLATVRVQGTDRRIVNVSHDTNAGMRKFELKAEM